MFTILNLEIFSWPYLMISTLALQIWRRISTRTSKAPTTPEPSSRPVSPQIANKKLHIINTARSHFMCNYDLARFNSDHFIYCGLFRLAFFNIQL